MSAIQDTVFQCKCENKKQYRLTLDGGPTGRYYLELCELCHQKENKRFVVKEVNSSF